MINYILFTKYIKNSWVFPQYGNPNELSIFGNPSI